MTNPASGDNTKAKPDIFKRASDATQKHFDKHGTVNDPAPRKDPTAK